MRIRVARSKSFGGLADSDIRVPWLCVPVSRSVCLCRDKSNEILCVLLPKNLAKARSTHNGFYSDDRLRFEPNNREVGTAGNSGPHTIDVIGVIGAAGPRRPSRFRRQRGVAGDGGPSPARRTMHP
jgi:hypothetical protein